MGMMQNCMEGMGSMMSGGVVLTLLVLLFAWVLGLAALGTLGVWAFRRFYEECSLATIC